MNLDLHPNLLKLRPIPVGRATVARRGRYPMLLSSVVSWTEKKAVSTLWKWVDTADTRSDSLELMLFYLQSIVRRIHHGMEQADTVIITQVARQHGQFIVDFRINWTL